MTLSELRRLAAKRANTSSTYIGVCFARHKGRWRSYTKRRGRQYHGGYWLDEADAARARDRLLLELLGGAARVRLNFPPAPTPAAARAYDAVACRVLRDVGVLNFPDDVRPSRGPAT